MHVVEMVEDHLEDSVELVDHVLDVFELSRDVILLLLIIRFTTSIGRNVAQIVTIGTAIILIL